MFCRIFLLQVSIEEHCFNVFTLAFPHGSFCFWFICSNLSFSSYLIYGQNSRSENSIFTRDRVRGTLVRCIRDPAPLSPIQESQYPRAPSPRLSLPFQKETAISRSYLACYQATSSPLLFTLTAFSALLLIPLNLVRPFLIAASISPSSSSSLSSSYIFSTGA